jgi:nudix-type nucleoside diphosphatase (YffH/AdpP family)
MRVEITGQRDVFQQFRFRIVEARLRHERFDGEMSAEITRLKFERGDSVAILMHDQDTDTIVLTEQFRYPSYNPDIEGSGWILELPAGSCEAAEAPEVTVRREVEEEVGFTVEEIEHLTTFYVSPGGTSERILLYYAATRPEHQTGEGGGLLTEGENIRRLSMKVDDALRMVKTGEIQDAKTIIALQWLEIRRLKQ